MPLPSVLLTQMLLLADDVRLVVLASATDASAAASAEQQQWLWLFMASIDMARDHASPPIDARVVQAAGISFEAGLNGAI